MTVVVRLDDKYLTELIRIAPRKAARAVKAAAFAVEGKAKQLAPVDTGALKNSLISKQRSRHEWRVQDGVEYGIYQELGFRQSRSGKFIQNPFLVPAVESIRRTFISNLRRMIDG